MEEGVSITVEEEVQVFTFIFVSHRTLEMVCRSDKTWIIVFREVTRISKFKASSLFVNSHVSVTLIESCLSLVHKCISLIVIDALLSNAKEFINLLLCDSASIESRSRSLPIPYYNTFVVTTRVQATKFPTVFSCTTEAFTSPKVGRIESKEACLVAVCHDVIRS